MNTKKHRATEPLAVDVRADPSRGAHRASHARKLLIAAGLGAVLIVVLGVLVTRG